MLKVICMCAQMPKRSFKMDKIAKVLNFTYDNETNSLKVVLEILDEAVKAEILRDMELTGKIVFRGEEVHKEQTADTMYVAKLHK